MNCEVFNLSPLRCEAFQAKETLRAVTHTILLARALGPCAPVDVDSALFVLTYVTCGDADVERVVEARLGAFASWVAKRGRDVARRGGDAREIHARVCVSFFERDRGDRGGGGLGGLGASGSGSGAWEQWRIPVEVTLESGDAGEGDGDGDAAAATRREARSMALQDELRGAVTHVLALVDQRKAHVPPVTRAGAVSFPFEITLPGDGASGTLGTLKQMMLASSPPAMLT
jgi:hypothetical protein